MGRFLADEADDLLVQPAVVDEGECAGEDVGHRAFSLGENQVHHVPEVRGVPLTRNVLEGDIRPVELHGPRHDGVGLVFVGGTRGLACGGWSVRVDRRDSRHPNSVLCEW